MPAMVDIVLKAHAVRNAETEATFKKIDIDRSGMIEQDELAHFVAGHMIEGRETYGWLARREDLVCLTQGGGRPGRSLSRPLGPRFEWRRRAPSSQVHELIHSAMKSMDTNNDGQICLDEFREWSRTNTIEAMVEQVQPPPCASARAAARPAATPALLTPVGAHLPAQFMKEKERISRKEAAESVKAMGDSYLGHVARAARAPGRVSHQ